PVLVDRTVRLFAAAPPAFSPNGDGVADDLLLSFELTRAASVRLDIAQAGKTVAPVYSADLPPGPQSVTWKGAGAKDGKCGAVRACPASSSDVSFALTPTPRTTRPSLYSASIPATFRPPTRPSPGIPTTASIPVPSAIASATAPPAMSESSGSLAAPTRGSN